MAAAAVTAALWAAGGCIALTVLLQRERRVRKQIQASLDQSIESTRRLARIEAAAEERERVYGDLHDDIGAKLLDLIYSAESPEQADLARSVLQDLRDVVSRSRGTPGSLLEVLGEIRAETEERLQRLDTGLVWEQAPDLPDPQFDHGQSLHLFRIVREAVSNAIRHSRATRLRVRIRRDDDELWLDITDDGQGMLADGASNRAGGSGTQNMRNRAAELHGSIRWGAGTLGGTKVALRIPLKPRQ